MSRSKAGRTGRVQFPTAYSRKSTRPKGPLKDEDHMMSGGLGPEPTADSAKVNGVASATKKSSGSTKKPSVNGVAKLGNHVVTPPAPRKEVAAEAKVNDDDDAQLGEEDKDSDAEAWESAEEAAEGDDSEESVEEEEDDDDADNDGTSKKMLDLATLLESESSADDEEEDEEDEDTEAAATQISQPTNSKASQGAVSEDEENEEDIPLSDLESLASEDRGDIVPHQRLTINNTTALSAAHKRIALPISKIPFSAHQSVTITEPINITDIDNDLERELAFYKQSLDAVTQARALLKKEGIPFSRPTDYFAEMVKSDEHMGRVRQKMVDAAAGKKASQDAKRQRELKKFGKQIQVAKLQERDKEKRATLDKITSLKRKRAGNTLTAENEPDDFDIQLDETTQRSSRRDGAPAGGVNKRQKVNHKRNTKNAKYGFGGKKRHAKSGDAFSSADMSGFSKGRGKGGAGKGGAAKSRPGKARRANNRL